MTSEKPQPRFKQDRFRQEYGSRSQQPRVQWQCVAHVKGRLKRSKPDEEGNRKLFFCATDGAMWPVLTLGREDDDSLIWMFTHIETVFNEDHIWALYPYAKGETEAVTPCNVLKGNRPVDVLKFSASVGNINLEARPGILPLFVGRNQGRGFHFCNLSIPEGFELPELSKGILVQGKATRTGATWVLSELVSSNVLTYGANTSHEKEI
ncbi:hypothetical protein [Pseudanabaena sp. FACHB-2040]|uniref:hypothetical protein n=1 Tax=Pseudanabaena sp. FACHB-2040 TaxID=2692859 RepID=UPI001684F817|nr:hypothetical protein [Pseudanabaena sp. FACHB-2040]MBD2261159.1 hypothetical protein [Pseudanabaena sp. FACHB-2040]